MLQTTCRDVSCYLANRYVDQRRDLDDKTQAQRQGKQIHFNMNVDCLRRRPVTSEVLNREPETRNDTPRLPLMRRVALEKIRLMKV